MMEGWEEVKLGDLADIYSGFAFKSKEMTQEESEGIPLVKIKNIFDRKVSKEFDSFLKHDFLLEKHLRYKLIEGDILVAMTGQGSVGRIGKMHIIDTPNYVNQRVGIVRVVDNKADKEFIYQQMANSHNETVYFNLAMGAGQPNLSPKDIGSLKINLPPIPTQRKIASILSAYDDLIENNLRRIKLLEEKAQLTYEEWFVRMKFPGHETTPINQGTGLPEGWERKPLGEFTKVFKGKNITKSTIREGNVPVVAGGLSPAYYHDTPNTKNPVITVSASGANAGFTNIYLEDVWASDCSYVDITMCDHLFFIYALMIHNQPKIYHFQKGAAQPHVYPKDLVRLESVIPTDDLLHKFDNISMNIFDTIRLFTKQNQNLKESRDILLPRLMTGMIDVEKMNLETPQPATA